VKRTTIFADETLLGDIKALADEEQRSVAEIIQEALVHYVQQKKHKRKHLSYIGVGASSKKNIAEQHEKSLWRKSER
jgi:metal-responsive CopG/Arc/MetJ family transcriptional regulator